MSDYQQIIKSLFERHQSVQTAGFSADSYKPGLDRIRELDRRAGSPSSRLRCIHVAGTNGKGSVCSLLAASLAGSGYRVGLFTSPHLLDFRERIKIVEEDSFEMIPKESVMEFLEKYDSPELSFFEITTGMAFWFFDREQVDIAVIEVGLGGLLDSTNIIVPELCVVTSIGLDHCALLGDTRALIAGQKAGIFKSGVPAVVGQMDAETAPVFEAAAAETHCPLFFAPEFDVHDCLEEYLVEKSDNNRLDAESPFQPSTPPDRAEQLKDLLARMDLQGECQEENLRTVLCALDLLGEEPNVDALCRAAAMTGLRGRWEAVRRSPLTIADIGHNPAALKGNFARLKEMMASGAYDRLLIVYGIMADKDLQGILPLMPQEAEYFFAAPDTPRALPAPAILSAAKEFLPNAQACDSVADAVSKASALATPQSLIYIGGSTFVVADYLKLQEI
jgi:dihydrofolate synthase/folylpolyglutamate synthase